MPITSNKRGRAPAAVTQEVKKAKVVDPTAEKVELITKTISEPDCQMQDSHRQMLLLSMPHSLALAADERHQYQTEVAKMVGEALKGYVGYWEQEVASSKANIAPLAEKANEAMKRVEESAAKINNQEEEVAKYKGILNEDSEAMTAAEEASKSASKEVAEFDENLKVTVAEKEHCSGVYNECFIPLRTGGLDAKEVTRLLKEVQPMLKKICTESSLLHAIAPACKKTSEERGPFDVMAIEGAEAVFTKRLGELQEQVDKADVTKAEKVNDETNAQDTLKAATEKRAASEETFKAAKEALASLEAKHLDFLAEMNKTAEVSAASEGVLATKEARLIEVQSALSAFEELLARETVKPDAVAEAVCEPMEMVAVA